MTRVLLLVGALHHAVLVGPRQAREDHRRAQAVLAEAGSGHPRVWSTRFDRDRVDFRAWGA